jgi:S-adenosylmethionine hydrolase
VLIVAAGGQLFLGPDNGVLAHVAREPDGAWAITSSLFRARTVSPTFHGRDVFAPAAARWRRGWRPSWRARR